MMLFVCKEGYEQVSMPAPRRPRTVSSPALPDTGAQMAWTWCTGSGREGGREL